MSDWRDLVTTSRRHARSNPIDWATIDAAIDRGLLARQRRQRQRQVGAGLLLAAAAAVVIVMMVRQPESRPKEIEPAEPFTRASAQQLMSQCAKKLPSGGATDQVVAVNDSKTTAAALVRDDDEAAVCVSIDANDTDVDPISVRITNLPPDEVRQFDWALMRTPDRLTYIAAVTTRGGRGPFSGLGVDVDFGPRKLKEKHRHTATLNLAVLEIPRPLNSDGHIVVGLTDDSGCECGSILELGDETFADPSPAQ